ncbi:hypothetical protein 278BB001_115 [Bacillus phage 278BB001]|nr:hypothetical protein 278BB001_115 [Bacillus phage 278BB001]
MSDNRKRPWDLSKFPPIPESEAAKHVCVSRVEGLSELSPLEAQVYFPDLPGLLSPISDEDVNYLFSKEASNTESRKRLREGLKAYREAKAKWAEDKKTE